MPSNPWESGKSRNLPGKTYTAKHTGIKRQLGEEPSPGHPSGHPGAP
jgi:hypothetical protein